MRLACTEQDSEYSRQREHVGSPRYYLQHLRAQSGTPTQVLRRVLTTLQGALRRPVFVLLKTLCKDASLVLRRAQCLGSCSCEALFLLYHFRAFFVRLLCFLCLGAFARLLSCGRNMQVGFPLRTSLSSALGNFLFTLSEGQCDGIWKPFPCRSGRWKRHKTSTGRHAEKPADPTGRPQWKTISVQLSSPR